MAKRILVLLLCMILVVFVGGCGDSNDINLNFSDLEFDSSFSNIEGYNVISKDIVDCFNELITAYNKSDKNNLCTLTVTDNINYLAQKMGEYSESGDVEGYARIRRVQFLLPCMKANALAAQFELDGYVNGTGPIAPERFLELRECIEDAYEAYSSGDLSGFLKE